ncbi:MAG: type I restriction enzyme HsdR N-terminal domain-containing protein [Lachnospiraceae bacterium]|nr:type I restriction enzyme HsdR N-terminal domain-containing protein [Lachnospiraceae bacterium]
MEQALRINLSVEQLRIVNSKSVGSSLIKGVAGSGKTTVALFKLANLLRNGLDGEKVLVVTYNKTLVRYMEFLCEEYGISLDSNNVNISTIDSVIAKLYNSCNGNTPNVDTKQQREMMNYAIWKTAEKFPNCQIINSKNLNFLIEEILWIKCCRYIDKNEYMNIDRLGRNSIGENTLRLAKNSESREAIFELFLQYENLLKRNGLTDYYSKALKTLEQIKSDYITPQRYRYIIVDESQDLSRVQLEIVKELYDEAPDSNIIFITDVAQSIYYQSWLSKQSFKSIGFDMSGRSNILSKNYRTTKQIAKASYSLINNDSELKSSNDFVEPELINRDGFKPRYRHFCNQIEEFDYVFHEIKKCTNTHNLRDIVIVARNKGYLNNMKQYLLKNKVDAEVFTDRKNDNEDFFTSDRVKLITMHSIKGLEAKVVFIVGLNKDIIPLECDRVDAERKLLYVGMTRAKDILYLTSNGEESQFIHEIDSNMLQLSDDEKEQFHCISIDDFLFLDKVKDVNQVEEQVRQWYLKVLQNNYGYSVEQIRIEDVIKDGSKTYYVDIAVYDDNTCENPFIYVETKSPGENLQHALKQLQSYNEKGISAKYLVVTDGNIILVRRFVDGRYIACNDIPLERYKFCTSYKYRDIKNNEEYEYVVDSDGKIYIKNRTQKINSTFNLFIIGVVTAGRLQYAYNNYLGTEIVPVRNVAGYEKFFLLQVSGDSMLEFGIDDGDTLVVDGNQSAQYGDIIVAGSKMLNEATVKQCLPYSDEYIMLHPGNKKYEDTYINVNDFFVNGVVVGVIKKY